MKVWIRGAAWRGVLAKLFADDVDSLGDGGGFVERDVAVAALATEAAVAGYDELLRGDVLEG